MLRNNSLQFYACQRGAQQQQQQHSAATTAKALCKCIKYNKYRQARLRNTLERSKQIFTAKTYCKTVYKRFIIHSKMHTHLLIPFSPAYPTAYPSPCKHIQLNTHTALALATPHGDRIMNKIKSKMHSRVN